jgi:hypothetical protein
VVYSEVDLYPKISRNLVEILRHNNYFITINCSLAAIHYYLCGRSQYGKGERLIHYMKYRCRIDISAHMLEIAATTTNGSSDATKTRITYGVFLS